MDFGAKILSPVIERWSRFISSSIAIFILIGTPLFRLIQRQRISSRKSVTRREKSSHHPLWTAGKVVAYVLPTSILHVLLCASFEGQRKKERQVDTLANTADPLTFSSSESRGALFKHLLEHLHRETLEALVRFLTERSQQEPATRSVALDTLETLRQSALHNPSMKAPSNDDTWLQIITSEAQRKFGDQVLSELALALIAALSNSEWLVRATAVQALGELGADVPLKLLTIILKSDEDYLVRTAAVRTIGRVKGSASLKLLITALRDPEWSVREMAALMLGEFGEVVPLEPLIKALYDEDESVREAAAQALWKLGKHAQEELLITAFLDEGGLIAATVEEVIREIGEFTLAQLLKSALSGEVGISSEIPLLTFLQERLAQDLIEKNELESPLWQWCKPLPSNCPDSEKANQQGFPLRPKELGTTYLTRWRDHILQNRRDRDEKGDMMEPSRLNLPRSSGSIPSPNSYYKQRFRKET